MHKEILSEKQIELFPNLEKFSKNFGLVGGTAIALHLGHRQSIDFDLVSLEEIDIPVIRRKIMEMGKIEMVIIDNKEEYTLIVNGVKFTFLHYPFLIKFSQKIEEVVPIPDLVTLAAMKAYALGRRAKWKDYVDLYFISEKLNSLQPVINRANEIFKNEFNEKNFRAQLSYFEDIDYSEKVIFAKDFETEDEEIRKKLIEYSVNPV